MLKVVRGPIEFRRGVGKLVEQCVEGFKDKRFVLLFNRGPCSELLPDLRLKKNKSRRIGSRAARSRLGAYLPGLVDGSDIRTFGRFTNDYSL